MSLVSPGVSITVANEGFYGTSGPGTVPLIVFATANNKLASGSTGVAPGTTPSTAGQVYLATSQRDSVLRFGAPSFKAAGGTPLHGHELNEYGLHAAYSYLGIANRAYMLRADIDLAALEARATAPAGPPVNGTFWLDTAETKFGLFQSNSDASPATAWVNRPVLTPTAAQVDGDGKPLSGFGADGSFAVVTSVNSNIFYEKIAGAWYRISNTTGAGTWAAQRPAVARSVTNPTSFPANGSEMVITSGNQTPVTVTFSNPASLSDVATQINTATTAINVSATIVSDTLVITQTLGDNLVIAGNSSALTPLGIAAKTYYGVRVNYNNTAQYPSNLARSGAVWIKLSPANNGAAWKLKYYNAQTAVWANVSVPFYTFNPAQADSNVAKDAQARAAVANPVVGFVYAGFSESTGVIQLRRWNGTQYSTLAYEAQATPPETSPVDGTLWYNADIRVDILVNDEGTHWKGYNNVYTEADPAGVLIAATPPVTQSDDTPLVENDLWIDSSDMENFPRLHRWDDTRKRWALVDKTDQTTPFGVVFADARPHAGPVSEYGSSHSTDASEAEEQMVLSNFLDPDAPDPRAYPEGMLLFNTRYSTSNVKVWRPAHFIEGGFDPETNYGLDAYEVGGQEFEALGADNVGRWVTASGNKVDGSPYCGRKAQRQMIVKAMAAAVASNEDIRSEITRFNLIAAPGYPELMDELVALNVDNKEVGFVVGDTPARLEPKASAIQAWATNANKAASTGEDGLTTASPFVGVYYPWGLTTNLDGQEIMVPPSTIALRTIAYNDQVSYPWYAPAGFQRGLVSNAGSVGYLTSEGEYRPVTLSQGQRDVLYLNKINPIAYIEGRGLVVYGQKTLEPLDSVLDRINVARLVNYLRMNLDQIVLPFLMEPNIQQTRDAARVTVERYLLGLVGQRALTDFVVICNEDNNTGERRARKELWIDVLIKPIDAIEFIMIPVRLRGAGDSLDY